MRSNQRDILDARAREDGSKGVCEIPCTSTLISRATCVSLQTRHKRACGGGLIWFWFGALLVVVVVKMPCFFGNGVATLVVDMKEHCSTATQTKQNEAKTKPPSKPLVTLVPQREKLGPQGAFCGHLHPNDAYGGLHCLLHYCLPFTTWGNLQKKVKERCHDNPILRRHLPAVSPFRHMEYVHGNREKTSPQLYTARYSSTAVKLLWFWWWGGGGGGSSRVILAAVEQQKCSPAALDDRKDK